MTVKHRNKRLIMRDLTSLITQYPKLRLLKELKSLVHYQSNELKRIKRELKHLQFFLEEDQN